MKLISWPTYLFCHRYFWAEHTDTATGLLLNKTNTEKCSNLALTKDKTIWQKMLILFIEKEKQENNLNQSMLHFS